MTPLAQTIVAFYLGGFAATLMGYVRRDIEHAPPRAYFRTWLVVTICLSVLIALAWPAFTMWTLVRASLGKSRKMDEDIMPAAIKWYAVMLRAKAGDPAMRDLFRAATDELFDAVGRHVDEPLVQKIMLVGTDKQEPRG